MRIVIAGGGDIAYQIAKRLSAERDIVVLESDRTTARQFETLDVQVIHGTATSTATLRGAGLTDSDEFIACSESDEQNIIACLAAKRIGGARTFCFVSKEEYYRSLAGEEDEEGILPDIDQVIWPQYMMAREISRIVMVPEAIDVEIFAKGRVWLMEFRLQQDSPLLGTPLRDLGLPRGALAVAVFRDDNLKIPDGATVFEPGDKVVFMGRRRALDRLSTRLMPRSPHGVNEVTIVGGGNVGLTLAKLLEQGRGLRLKVIEVSRERCDEVAAELRSAIVLHGDGADLGLLREEHIDQSEVLVSVTSYDEKNLLCSLLGLQMEIPKIITRVNEPSNMSLFEDVGIDVPLNPRVTAIQALVASMKETEVKLLATLEAGRGQVVEVVVPDDFPVTRVRDFPSIPGAIIGAALRGRRSLVPHGDDYIKPGDRLLVLCTREAEPAVQRYF